MITTVDRTIGNKDERIDITYPDQESKHEVNLIPSGISLDKPCGYPSAKLIHSIHSFDPRVKRITTSLSLNIHRRSRTGLR